MQSIGDAVIASDSELPVSFVNAVAERLTGWTHAEALAQPASEVRRIRTRGGEDIADLIGAAMRGFVVLHIHDATLLTRDATELLIDHSIALMRDESGRASGWVMSFRDSFRDGRIRVRHESHVRELEAEFESKLREQTARLEATNQELPAHAQNIAHDVRVPIRAIDWFASRLTDEHAAWLSSTGRRLVAKMRRASSQA